MNLFTYILGGSFLLVALLTALCVVPMLIAKYLPSFARKIELLPVVVSDPKMGWGLRRRKWYVTIPATVVRWLDLTVVVIWHRLTKQRLDWMYRNARTVDRFELPAEGSSEAVKQAWLTERVKVLSLLIASQGWRAWLLTGVWCSPPKPRAVGEPEELISVDLVVY